MDYNDGTILALAYWGSNAVGLVFLLVAFKWTRLARLMFAVLFGYAFWINYHLSHSNPAVYLDYAQSAVGLYANFIRGWFSHNITAVVTFIAIGQLFIALGMLLRHTFVSLASIGAIIFLMAIAPLGVYAAFPFSITVSLAAYCILKEGDKQFLWEKRQTAQGLYGPFERPLTTK